MYTLLESFDTVQSEVLTPNNVLVTFSNSILRAVVNEALPKFKSPTVIPEHDPHEVHADRLAGDISTVWAVSGALPLASVAYIVIVFIYPVG